MFPVPAKEWTRACRICPWIEARGEEPTFPFPQDFLLILRSATSQPPQGAYAQEEGLSSLLPGQLLFRRQVVDYPLVNTRADPHAGFEQYLERVTRYYKCRVPPHYKSRVPRQDRARITSQLRDLWKTEVTLRAAYAGWLMTHQRFQQEVQELERKWGNRFRSGRAVFPLVRAGWEDAGIEFTDMDLLHPDKAYRDFCTRWSLYSLATWKLPVPSQVPHFGHALGDLHGESGVILYVPNWFARIETTGAYLADLLKLAQTRGHGGHLQGWAKDRKGLERPARYAQYLRVWYVTAALKQRPWGASVSSKLWQDAIRQWLADSAGLRVSRDTLYRITSLGRAT